MKEEIEVEYTIIIVIDSWKNKSCAVYDDMYTTVQFTMKDKLGKDQHFESNAYHVHTWCEEFGFKYKEIKEKRTIKI